MRIFRFKPIFKSLIWGGDKIAARKNIQTDLENIGESWELSGVKGNVSVVADGPDAGLTLTALIDKYGAWLMGERVISRTGDEFPLLVKFIDARRDLSVQVHPDDRLARARHNCPGKTEMWYVLEADPDAHIYAGLSKSITPDDYDRLVADKNIMDVVACHDAKADDVFFLPAGRIHAIGAGVMLLEIQQTSDITYRVYDYDRRDADGNPRQLHTAEAREAIDYAVYPDYVTDYDRAAPSAELVCCSHFTVRRHNIDTSVRLDSDGGSFTIVTCVGGQCQITADDASVTVNAYETVLVPAAAHQITCQGPATIVTATC